MCTEHLCVHAYMIRVRTYMVYVCTYIVHVRAYMVRVHAYIVIGLVRKWKETNKRPIDQCSFDDIASSKFRISVLFLTHSIL